MTNTNNNVKTKANLTASIGLRNLIPTDAVSEIHHDSQLRVRYLVVHRRCFAWRRPQHSDCRWPDNYHWCCNRLDRPPYLSFDSVSLNRCPGQDHGDYLMVTVGWQLGCLQLRGSHQQS